MRTYDPFDWYWLVEETGRYWSSAQGAYIDQEPDDGALTKIDTEANLNEVLKVYGLAGPSRLLDLEPDRFWMALRFFGYEASLRAWVDGLRPTNIESETYAQDLAFWSAVSSKLEWAKYFERAHPMIEGARQALGITEQQLDDMWIWALS